MRTIDGSDVEAVREAALEALAEFRASGRPRFLELVIYRQRGHFEPPARLLGYRLDRTGRDSIEARIAHHGW